ncbi:MAG TPA: penicillin-insensitive murein endopeptidase [Amaricoccus sp.]|nr:penicillin-insensitive murein endopeptidase [Amaricoccus sp.]
MTRFPLMALVAAGLAFALPGAQASAQTARQLFAAKSTPSPHDPYSIGQASRGCLAGGVQLPESGPTWQAMRLGRNHHWGNPAMIEFIEELSRAATRAGWKGLYVGDIGQARGGPVPGHASHQIGLDVDVWLTPPPRLDLSRSERERVSATSVLAGNKTSLNRNWTPSHAALTEAIARDPRVNRIFITPPVKLALCASAGPGDAAWLRKVRPWWDHTDHWHIRLNCPKGAPGCVDQTPLPPGDGCKEAIWWVTDALLPPDPDAPKTPPKPPLRLADLPPQCAAVLEAR